MKPAAPLLRCAAAALALAAAAPLAAEEAAAPAAAAAATAETLTPEDARAWIAKVEADMAQFIVEYGRVSWINATYINHDTSL